MTPNACAAEPVALIGDANSKGVQVNCPKCQSAFQPKRRNQTYCTPQCQKNASRGSREAKLSPSQRYTNRREWSLLHWLNETYYGTRPDQRLGLLKDWLDQARAGNKSLRRVLTRPEFFAPDVDERTIFFRRCSAYPPVPFLADWFSLKFRGCRVWEWVNGSAVEPETGEVLATDNPPPGYVVGHHELDLRI